MIHLFDTIDYLKKGNLTQQRAYAALTGHQVMEKLSTFDPILAGTIPLNIDIEGSDLDIVCYYSDQQQFIQITAEAFQHMPGFSLRIRPERQAVVVNFFAGDLEVELFAQNIPSRQQMAYRHMLVEYHLLELHGEDFRKKVIALKQQGIKTEPAFALLLGLEGDPYTALLVFET